MEVEVRAELVSTIIPTAPGSPDGPSTASPENSFSSLTPTPSPELKPAAPAGRPPLSGLVLSSVHSGEGLGLRGEVRIRAGFDTGDSSD